jgi:hypothetical protein
LCRLVGVPAMVSTAIRRADLGTVTKAAGIWSSDDGFRMLELAWQQFLRRGEMILIKAKFFKIYGRNPHDLSH